MDFSLLNFWINSLNLDIRHDQDTLPKLYLSLKAYSKDPLYSFVLPLSDNKHDILKFLGFDTTIEFDKLSEKNVFEYLCTSSILDPKYIQYTGFKGPHAKNRTHEKFNDYLKDKKYPKTPDKEHYENKKKKCDTFKKQAIAFFKKEKEYIEYKSEKHILDEVFERLDMINNVRPEKANFIDFERFVVLHGVFKVSQMTEKELLRLWDVFVTQNWSGLVVFCRR